MRPAVDAFPELALSSVDTDAQTMRLRFVGQPPRPIFISVPVRCPMAASGDRTDPVEVLFDQHPDDMDIATLRALEMRLFSNDGLARIREQFQRAVGRSGGRAIRTPMHCYGAMPHAVHMVVTCSVDRDSAIDWRGLRRGDCWTKCTVVPSGVLVTPDDVGVVLTLRSAERFSAFLPQGGKRTHDHSDLG